MKRVRPLLAEPQALAAYRRRHPRDAQAPGSEAGKVWERFRKDRAQPKKAVQQELLDRQQGLCGYCESRVSLESSGTLIVEDQQIEHVLAKSGGPGRALDWTNLMLCCQGGTGLQLGQPNGPAATTSSPPGAPKPTTVSCGHAKGELALAPGCDPRTFPLSPRLVSVDLQGALVVDAAACQAAGIPPAALQTTIDDILALNCTRLKAARQQVAASLRATLLQLLQETTEDQQRAGLELLVAARLSPDTFGHLRSFWTTEREILEPQAEHWLQQNGGLF